ncbi:hypothetical protein GY12_15960 [Micrococcus luteus]|nr:hypothetical protein GY12_15960 [Micrococcus luteus]
MVLVDRGFWDPLVDWIRGTLVERGMISPEDPDLFQLVDTAEEAVAWVLRSAGEGRRVSGPQWIVLVAVLVVVLAAVAAALAGRLTLRVDDPAGRHARAPRAAAGAAARGGRRPAAAGRRGARLPAGPGGRRLAAAAGRPRGA